MSSVKESQEAEQVEDEMEYFDPADGQGVEAHGEIEINLPNEDQVDGQSE